MNPEALITDHLVLWTGATTKKSSRGRGSNGKIELTGIDKLRKLILELAVRGLLTEQRICESDASEIVANLHKEQKRLVAAGLIKKSKPLKPLNEVEKPYPLPKGWQWVRLGQTMEMYNGRAFKSSEWSTSGLPIIRIQNLNDPKAPTNYFSGPLNDRHSIDTGTFLISWSGTPGTSFGAFIWNRGPAALNQHINKCVFFGDFLVPKFMQLAVNGKMKNFIQSAQGGVGLKHVTKGVLANALIALPPKEEQHRIVQKVDELMTLCDRLEQQTSDQIAAHDTLVDTLLGTLTQSQNATELAENWTRLAAHFDTLFTTEQSIDKLKQTILQLAVMGRLVEQDSGDEPATAFLQRFGIKSEPYFLNGWAEVTLGDFGEITGGSTPSKAKAEFWNGSIPWVSPKDMKAPLIIDSQDRITEKALQETTLKTVPARSILMVIRGMILAHSFPVAIAGRPLTINQDMKALIPPKQVSTYLLLYLQASKSSIVGLVERSSHGTCKLVSKTLWSQTIRLPPLEEQHRIAQKVDKLMNLCDQLKEQLSHSIKTQCLLAEAIVEGAIQ